MEGIDLNKPVMFKHSSLRYFSENEHHITRFCEDDVLLLVFEGVLRFSENAISYEVYPGEYHIQKRNTFQKGEIASDSPKYLYVHFIGEWADNDTTLPFRGTFDYIKAKPFMEKLDQLSHTNSTFVQKSFIFFELLLLINQKNISIGVANRIAEFVDNENLNEISLEKLCREFNFSKNHMINIFKKEFGITPVKYINNVKLERAKYLLEVTSEPIESISHNSGFNDYSHFYKLFYRENGMSPAEWRTQKQVHPSVLR